jgi:hypothetical protein
MPTTDLPFIVSTHMSGELSATLTQAQAVEAFEIWLTKTYNGGCLLERAQRELPNKDLMCYCKLTDMCHADIWLRLVNEETTK